MSHAQAPVRRHLAAIAAALIFALSLPGLAIAHGRGHEQATHHPSKQHRHGDDRHHGRDHRPHGKPHGDHGRGHVVNTMTRNLYLGADLAPAIGAKSLGEFVEKNGQILREVTANDFPTRAKGLANEILEKQPDLVGLQEVALWRTGPPSLAPLQTGPSATTVRYDYLQELLGQLNKAKRSTKSSSPSRSSTSRRRLTRTASPTTVPPPRGFPTRRSTAG